MAEGKAMMVSASKRWSLSPTVRISMGLVSMLLGLLMILDLALKILPDKRAMTMAVREQVAVHLAVQGSDPVVPVHLLGCALAHG